MEKLTPPQLAPFVGTNVEFNNGRTNLVGILTPILLHNFGNGSVTAIIPILRPLTDMKPEEFRTWLNDSSFGDKFAEENIAKFKSVYGLHFFISQHGHYEAINWLCQNGFDPFFYIYRGLAHNKLNYKNEKPDTEKR